MTVRYQNLFGLLFGCLWRVAQLFRVSLLCLSVRVKLVAKKRTKTVYVVVCNFGYDGYGDPEAVFWTEEAAHEYVDTQDSSSGLYDYQYFALDLSLPKDYQDEQ